MIRITCPFCNYSKDIEETKVPSKATQVICPMCNETFAFPFFRYKKASLFTRLLAFIIDMLLLNVIFLLLSFILDLTLSYFFQYVGITDRDLIYKIVGSIIYFFSVFIMFFYFTFTTYRYGMTFGKRILAIKVVNEMGKPLTIVDALKREVLGKILSSLFLGLGFFWALVDSNNQTFHDKIAKTYVIDC